jgi:HK97 family phage prohead protease
MNTITNENIHKIKCTKSAIIKAKTEDNKVLATIYTNEIDRDKDQATSLFLENFANIINKRVEIGAKIPILTDHDWKADGIIGRVLGAELKQDDELLFVEIELNIIDEEAKDKLDKELYLEMSSGFDCIRADADANGICQLLDCTDVFEVSFVAVPAVPGARVTQKSFEFISKDKDTKINIKNSIGGKSMNKFSLKRLFDKHPELKGLDPEVIDDIKAAETEEIKAEDVEALIEENEKLSKENEELRAEVKTLKEAEEVKKSEEGLAQAIAEALEGATVSDKTKEYIDSEVKAGCTDTKEEDAIKEVVSTVVEKYKDLGLVEWAEQEVEEPEHTEEEQEVKEEEVKEVEDSSTVDIDETLNEEEDKKVKAKKSYNDISNFIIEEKGKVTKKSYNNNYNHTLSNGCFIE